MNIKKATNSELSTTDSKTKQSKTKKPKQTGTGIESQVWRYFGGLADRKGENGQKHAGTKKHNCRQKIDRGKLRIVQKMEKPKNLYA